MLIYEGDTGDIYAYSHTSLQWDMKEGYAYAYKYI